MPKSDDTQKTPEELAVEVIGEMDREFHDSSDRVIAVVGGAYLDSMLEQLLTAAFIDAPQDVKSLLRPDGALGSNGARYSLAYCLGLITSDQRDDLKMIAKIRNRFAHDFKIAAFTESPIRDFCAELKQPGMLAEMAIKTFASAKAEAEFAVKHILETNATPREQFRTTVFSLFGSLVRRLTYVRRVESAAWFSYDPDALVGPASKQTGG